MIWVYTNMFGIMILNSSQVDTPLVATDYAGIVMFVIGVICEFEADRSKDVFRDQTENRNKFCNTSLWQWSRHPNYFGKEKKNQIMMIEKERWE